MTMLVVSKTRSGYRCSYKPEKGLYKDIVFILEVNVLNFDVKCLNFKDLFHIYINPNSGNLIFNIINNKIEWNYVNPTQQDYKILFYQIFEKQY